MIRGAMSAAKNLRASVEEYLAYDLVNEGRHEFLNGEILAMAGASDAHVVIHGNLQFLVGRHRRGGPCRPLGPDLRVFVGEAGNYLYPDLVVVCGQREYAPTNPPSLLNPKVVFEVISPSTEALDRGPKAAHYRLRASVEAYVLICSDRRSVEVQTRGADGAWSLHEATHGSIRIGPLELELELEPLYEAWEG